ncbi:hypothetical protein GGR52DRAFT_240153 [Hypoxylon sp. FL1284]|nr:hypothetical protein GGR52DRAFT_240153 [Hypoxylon sp. FL1284]
MSWTNEGAYWRRPLDCHDKLFQSIAAAGAPLGREHWLMVGWLQLAFPIDMDPGVLEQRLRGAWSALRLRHPDVALTLNEDEKRYEPLADDEVLQRWTDATFCVESASSVDELFSRHLKVTPSVYATCHWVPARSEVAVVSSHWRWDGRGLMMMLDSFMVLLAHPSLVQPVVGAETANLVPTLDAVIGVPKIQKEEWIQKADELLAPFLDGSPAAGLPFISTLPGNTVRVETVFPKLLSRALREACRGRGLRITAALQASVVQETARCYFRTAGADPKARYKAWAAFDLRKHCPPPPSRTAHAPSIRMVALPLVANLTESWDVLASTFQAQYAQELDPAHSDALFVRVPYVEKATVMLATAPPSSEPNLSNLGVLEDFVERSYGGKFLVQNVTLAVQMLSPQLYVHAWSWCEQTRVSICYNEAFYEEDFVNKWLEALKANLLENLGVELPG